jgi:hypothetical protein
VTIGSLVFKLSKESKIDIDNANLTIDFTMTRIDTITNCLGLSKYILFLSLSSLKYLILPLRYDNY